MREIKFRAWNKAHKRFAPEKEDYTITMNGVVKDYPPGDMTWDRWEEARDIVIMQFTGLLDKNGVEIYEGDLLGNTMEGFAIAWDEELHSFWPINQYMPEEKSDVHWYEIVEMAGQKRLEVIGNIYENPELLDDGVRVDDPQN